VIEFLEQRVLLDSTSFQLLSDINASTGDAKPGAIVECNGKMLFSASTRTCGNELWVSDGTQAGTRLVKDLNPGLASSSPSYLTRLDATRVVFWASDPSGVNRLWITDGTARGTAQVSTTLTISSSVNARFTLSEGKLCFGATDGTKTGVYVTDGTTAGTKLLLQTFAYSGAVAFNGSVYFLTNYNGGTLSKLNPDGSTVAVTPAGSSAKGPLLVTPSAIYFTCNNDPWRSDGTPAGTAQVLHLTGNLSSMTDAGELDNGKVVFTINGSAYCRNLNGSVSGPLLPGQLAEDVLALGNVAYISATTDAGVGLYVTSGTTTGTTLVRAMGTASIKPQHLTQFGQNVLFKGTDLTAGQELWFSDGTTAGTYLLNDIYPGTSSSVPVPAETSLPVTPFTVFEGSIYFIATEPIHGYELWCTNGTAAGTRMAADIYTESKDAILQSWTNFLTPQDGVAYAGKTYFNADDGVHGLELWRTDGTRGGTELVVDLFPGVTGSSPSSLIVYNNSLFFEATYQIVGGSSALGLFKSDGTAAGTTQIYSAPNGTFTPFVTGRDPVLFPFKGKLAFFGTQSSPYPAGTSLWLTDGTSAGTVRAGGVIANSTAAASSPVVCGDYLYFISSQGAGYPDLLRHDGTAWSNIAPDSNPSSLTNFHGTLVFTNSSSGQGTQLWTADNAGARQIAGFAPTLIASLGDYFYFGGRTSDSLQSGLFRSDGSTSGTARISSLYPVAILMASAGKLWGFATGGSPGTEPFVSDGTTTGTFSLGDLNPGSASSNVTTAFVDANDGHVYFAAKTAQIGTELFRSDGTPGGTILMGDFIPGTSSSSPGAWMTVGTDRYVTIDTLDSGREWRRVSLDTDPPIVEELAFNPEFTHTLSIAFSEDVAGSFVANDVELRDASGLLLDRSQWSFASGLDAYRTSALIGLLPRLADGNYSVRIPAGSVADLAGNVLSGDVGGSFFVLSGDANRDRKVNTEDFNILAANFGESIRTFYQGDFTYDSSVTSADFNVLVSQYGKTVPAPAASGIAAPAPPLFSIVDPDAREWALDLA
jgi:ELWxxDGT repeat protein